MWPPLARALRWIAAGALALGLAACRLGPSFPDYVELLRSRAGEDAVDCGVTRLHQHRAAAVACSTAALEDGRPFFVLIQVQGFDSDIFFGLSVDDRGRAVRTIWYSDVYGGGRSPLLSRASTRDTVCENPRVVLEGPPVQCEGDRPHAA